MESARGRDGREDLIGSVGQLGDSAAAGAWCRIPQLTAAGGEYTLWVLYRRKKESSGGGQNIIILMASLSCVRLVKRRRVRVPIKTVCLSVCQTVVRCARCDL